MKKAKTALLMLLVLSIVIRWGYLFSDSHPIILPSTSVVDLLSAQ